MNMLQVNRFAALTDDQAVCCLCTHCSSIFLTAHCIVQEMDVDAPAVPELVRSAYRHDAHAFADRLQTVHSASCSRLFMWIRSRGRRHLVWMGYVVVRIDINLDSLTKKCFVRWCSTRSSRPVWATLPRSAASRRPRLDRMSVPGITMCHLGCV